MNGAQLKSGELSSAPAPALQHLSHRLAARVPASLLMLVSSQLSFHGSQSLPLLPATEHLPSAQGQTVAASFYSTFPESHRTRKLKAEAQFNLMKSALSVFSFVVCVLGDLDKNRNMCPFHGPEAFLRFL